MDNRLTPKQQDALIEDALNSYPLAPMPNSITENVMSCIQKNARPALVTWNDFVLSLVIAVYIATLFITVQSLPPILVLKLQIQGILLYQNILVNARWLVPAVLFGLAAFLFALPIPYLQRQLKP